MKPETSTSNHLISWISTTPYLDLMLVRSLNAQETDSQDMKTEWSGYREHTAVDNNMETCSGRGLPNAT